MARNVLIPIIYIQGWNKSEKTKFLISYNAALPRPTSSSNPDQPSVQNESGEGIPVLHIPAELSTRFLSRWSIGTNNRPPVRKPLS